MLPFPNLDMYAFEAEESLCEEDSNSSTAVQLFCFYQCNVATPAAPATVAESGRH